ncbi:MAG: helix-turn-helix transcriptional regulator [Bacteroidales bacterium]|nr:helix-turn-helix transcriptional regulator [Bacteroidales bacterium]
MNDLVETLLVYLQQSHAYYLNNALVALSDAIDHLIAPCTPSRRMAVRRFFDEYRDELERHFQYEESEVLPYVKGLLAGRRRPGFSIEQLKENHAFVDEKFSDLRNLINQSLPEECDPCERRALLVFIYTLRKDIHHHTSVEEDILVPLVRILENPAAELPDDQDDGQGAALSVREKEILVSVARGLLNKEIADEHHISINTVITHRKNITRKTGIKTVPGLTAYALLNGLVDISEIE